MNQGGIYFKYTYMHIQSMAHKTITISDNAYEALAKSKRENESFTKVILRLTSGSGRASLLLEHLRDSPADEELAGNTERAMQRTRSARLRPADLSRG
jgi:predicted CopG family antitoxin